MIAVVGDGLPPSEWARLRGPGWNATSKSPVVGMVKWVPAPSNDAHEIEHQQGDEERRPVTSDVTAYVKPFVKRQKNDAADAEAI